MTLKTLSFGLQARRLTVEAGYSAAFLTLAGIALAAFIFFVIAMPETAGSTVKRRHEAATSAEPTEVATAGTLIGSG